MKNLIKILIVSAVAMMSVFADQGMSGEYLPAREDANVVDKNISKRIEVVFYRIGGAKEFVPTVKVNDKVVGSLMPDNYAKTFVCNRHIKVGVAQRGDSINTTSYSAVAKDNANIVFIKVLESAEHKFTLAQVDPDSAKSEISHFKLKSNIINRHVPNCELNITDYTSRNEIVSGSILTVFFETDSFDLTADAKEKLNKFISWIKEYENIETITIKSYADTMGSKKYNLLLSQNRARSVKDYISTKNINISFDVNFFGETSQFSKDCSGLKGLFLAACLQENRRVDLNIITYKGAING